MAEALRDWIPNVLQFVEPWMSDVDIEKGARWGENLGPQLEGTQVGIICLTPENLEAPQILFETGALSQTLRRAFVYLYLLELEPADIKGPLAQFQMTKASKDDTRKLVHTINQALGEDALSKARIDEAIGIWWPKLKSQLENLPDTSQKTRPERSDREILEEILVLVRVLARSSQRRPRLLRKLGEKHEDMEAEEKEAPWQVVAFSPSGKRWLFDPITRDFIKVEEGPSSAGERKTLLREYLERLSESKKERKDKGDKA
ncbi:MAG: hypothetical protein ACE5JP_05305 [Candidatus Bipolaricaulia bacterium]